MVNRSKAIGTAGESAVVKIVLPYFPQAERLALAGAQDEGDIGHCGDFIFEVKSGKAAENAGDGLLAKWTLETAAEVQNRGVQYGVLILKRKGVGLANAHRWWAYVDVEDLARWTGGEYIPNRFNGTLSVRLELGQLLEMLADLGLTVDDPEAILATA
jgi:hypothetical protein